MFKNLFKKAKKLCTNKNGRPYLKIIDTDLEKHVKSGLSNRKIAVKMRCSESTIRNRRKLYNI